MVIIDTVLTKSKADVSKEGLFFSTLKNKFSNKVKKRLFPSTPAQCFLA
jgi:hypothetical protein